MIDRLGDVPYSKKLDLYVDGKGSLELDAQIETFFVFPLVHGVRKWQLFDVTLREKSDFLKHAGESTSRESTARETENAYPIPNAI